jgi:hypothetical protein
VKPKTFIQLVDQCIEEFDAAQREQNLEGDERLEFLMRESYRVPRLTRRMTYELFYASVVSFYSKTLTPKMRHYFS